MTSSDEAQANIEDKKQTIALTYAAFVAGLCSIVYELLIATTVSYFLGDSVRYFSLTIGMYMAAMGAG
jgi:spermidine synthase